MGVMEGRDSKHIRASFEDIYQPALLANWKIWPAAQVSQLAYHIHFGIW
jgi:protein Mpv17